MTTRRAIAVLVCAALTIGVLCEPATATADTVIFPELSRFIPVNPADYGVTQMTPGHTNVFTEFLTPDGIPCDFADTPWMEASAGCTAGTLPGVSVPAPTVDYFDNGRQRHAGVFGISTNIWLRTFSDPPPETSQLRALPPGHSISQYGVTCGVDDSQMIACIDPKGRGFMLSPRWSGWLPQATPGQPIAAAPIRCSYALDITTCRDGSHGFVSTTSDLETY